MSVRGSGGGSLGVVVVRGRFLGGDFGDGGVGFLSEVGGVGVDTDGGDDGSGRFSRGGVGSVSGAGVER